MLLATEKLLPLSRVAQIVSVDQSRVRDWIEGGLFPTPVELPDGEERWCLTEISEWLCVLRSQRKAPEKAPDRHRIGTDEAPRKLPPKSVAIVNFLKAEKAWFTGAEIAKEVSPRTDPASGYWKKILSDLVKAELLESESERGYRITEKGTGWAPE